MKPSTWIRPGRRRWRRTSWTPTRRTRPAGCPAGDLVPYRFRSKVRTWRERHHPDSIEKRHAKSAKDRRVEFRPDSDGMAWFSAYLPADTAAGIWDRTTAAARALQGPDEARTLTQLRADVAAILLLTTGTDADGNGNGTSRRGCAGPAGAGPHHRPGPVPAGGHGGTGDAGRVRADPAVDGPAAGRRRRRLLPPGPGRPPGRGAAGNRADQLPPHEGYAPVAPAPRRPCPFPGCNNPSLDNDADHLLAWADGGTTGITNLGQPCRKHHRLKHASAWTPSRASKDKPPGWTSPSGRYYPSEQQDWEPPHWPPGILTRTSSRPRTQCQDPATRLGSRTCPRIRGWDPDLDLPPDPGRDPNLELPPAPFPDWHEFTVRALMARRRHGPSGLAGASRWTLPGRRPDPMSLNGTLHGTHHFRGMP